jgi:general secretion pathway protein M
MMRPFMQWWNNLAARERWFVSLGGAAALLILLYAVLAPLNDRVSTARERLAQKNSDLRWIEANAAQLQAAGPGNIQAATRENALVLIDRAARESGLGSALSSLEPAGDGAMRANLSAAPFDAMVAWLARLRQQHGVSVAGASVTANAAPGLVNATVQLRLVAP